MGWHDVSYELKSSGTCGIDKRITETKCKELAADGSLFLKIHTKNGDTSTDKSRPPGCYKLFPDKKYSFNNRRSSTIECSEKYKCKCVSQEEGCRVCGEGTYSKVDKKTNFNTCQQCPNGQFTYGTKGLTGCIKGCNPGYEPTYVVKTDGKCDSKIQAKSECKLATSMLKLKECK
eukprot:g5245.t1